MKVQKLALTGASGFLGRRVVAALESKNIPFVSLGRESLVSVDTIARALDGTQEVLHTAGLVNGSADDLAEANTRLMQRMVEGAQKAGVSKIIYVSSAAAEHRNGPYGQSKWEAEEILKSSGIPYLIFHPTLLFGAGDRKNVATMIKTIARLPVIPLLGGGAALIQPLYVEDFVNVLIRALDSPISNRIYNAAGPAQISLKEMIVVLATALHRKPKLITIPLEPVQALVRFWVRLFPRTRLPVKQILELHQHRFFDIAETRKELEFNPRTFSEGVRAMFSMAASENA